ncbi:hypothetical protein, partial [Phocaeicola intestinalis]|uniref:hypothetical protein n=1 Tax=Phocaeicola intestinalis TaxID=2762212 RepID=UPI001CD893E9
TDEDIYQAIINREEDMKHICDIYRLEVTKRVYSIGNERVLVAHYGNRLRISKLSTALFFCALRNLQRTLRMQR